LGSWDKDEVIKFLGSERRRPRSQKGKAGRAPAERRWDAHLPVKAVESIDRRCTKSVTHGRCYVRPTVSRPYRLMSWHLKESGQEERLSGLRQPVDSLTRGTACHVQQVADVCRRRYCIETGRQSSCRVGCR